MRGGNGAPLRVLHNHLGDAVRVAEREKREPFPDQPDPGHPPSEGDGGTGVGRAKVSARPRAVPAARPAPRARGGIDTQAG